MDRERESFLFGFSANIHVFAQQEPADGLKAGRRSVTSAAVWAVWMAEPPPHKKVTPPKKNKTKHCSDSDSHARERRSDKVAEERYFPFAEAVEEHAHRGRVTDRLKTKRARRCLKLQKPKKRKKTRQKEDETKQLVINCV